MTAFMILIRINKFVVIWKWFCVYWQWTYVGKYHDIYFKDGIYIMSVSLVLIITQQNQFLVLESISTHRVEEDLYKSSSKIEFVRRSKQKP